MHPGERLREEILPALDLEDAMIAATAAVHRLTIAIRNVRDFEGLGVLTFNPFETKAG